MHITATRTQRSLTSHICMHVMATAPIRDMFGSLLCEAEVLLCEILYIFSYFTEYYKVYYAAVSV